MAIRIDASGDYLSRTANLPSTTAFTICGWFRRRGNGDATAEALFSLDDGGTNYITSYCGGGGSGIFALQSTGESVAYGDAVTTDQWYYAALSCSGTGASDAALRWAARGATAFSSISVPGKSFTPPGVFIGAISTAGFNANIAVSGVKLYDRVLTDAELLAEMNRLTPASTTNLNAWWPMVADVAATADNDYSGNARDLTPAGTITVEDGPPVGWGAPVLVVGAAASGSTYTLDAGSGSYTLTGSAADLLLTRKINAEAGSYALTGSDATLVRRIALNAESGSYAVTGADATLVATRRINAEAGSYTLTGSDASLLATRRLDAEAGSYTLTGADAELVKTGSYALDAQAGSYTVSGADASLLVTRKLNAEAGSYNLSGADAGLAVSRLLNAEAGSYIITGADAELARAGVYALDAEAGSYGITGANVVFLAPSGLKPAGRSTRGKRRRVVIGERVYEVNERDIPALIEAELLDRAPPATAEHVAGPKPPQKRRRKAVEPVKTVEQVREVAQQIKARIEPDNAWLLQALETVAFRVLERLQDEEDSLMLLLAA